MGLADSDFEKEWPVIMGAPEHFFGGIVAIIVPSILLIWFLVNWAYRHRLAAKDAQLDEREERVTRAKEHQQYTEQKNKDLQHGIEKLEAQIKAKSSFDDIALSVSIAKTTVDELVNANAVLYGILNATEGTDKANLSGKANRSWLSFCQRFGRRFCP